MSQDPVDRARAQVDEVYLAESRRVLATAGIVAFVTFAWLLRRRAVLENT